MSTVLTGIDGSPISAAVLEVAKEIARVLDAQVDAVHVLESEDASEVEVSGGATPLRLLRGDPSSVLIAEAEAENVAAVVVGSCRDVDRPGAAGHVSLDVIGGVRKPLVVVPPMTELEYALHTVLVPVQGRPARALEDVVRLAENPELHVVILRLLDETTIPSFEDQPHYDVEAWAGEFLARWVPGAGSDTAMEVRIGDPQDVVVSVAHEICADLVAIGRRRDLPATDAPLVLAALERSRVPIALLPLARRARETASP